MIETVDYALLKPNPFQPKSRWPLAPDSVRELADDIAANGLIHTPVGRRTDSGAIEIAVGHRRVTAFVIARPGEPVPVELRELSDRQMYDYVIGEGSHRLDWTAIEKGERLMDYIQRFGVTQAEAAKRFNLSQGAASNLVRLARDLPAEAKSLVNTRALPERFARQIVTLAKVDAKAAVKIAKSISGADDARRDEIAQEQTADFLKAHCQEIDNTAWPKDWKPVETVTIDGAQEIPPACAGCAFSESAFGDSYCTRPACFEAKCALWIQLELAHLSKKFGIQIAAQGEALHTIAINWNNDHAAKELLGDKTFGRDHLRLAAQYDNDEGRDYYTKSLLGSVIVRLCSTRDGYVIRRNEPEGKRSGAAKSPPADETPAQRDKRKAREEAERASRREEKAALRRAKTDVLWLLINTSERMGPEVLAFGGLLEYCYELAQNRSSMYTHVDWPEYVAVERELESKIKASTGAVREDRLRQAILLGQMRRDIGAYKPEEEYDVERDIAIISDVIGKTFRLELPKGWHDIPIHTTPRNCHVCGRFTSLDHISKIDEAAGWQRVGDDGLVTCSDECRAKITKSKPAPKPKAKRGEK